MWVHFQNIIYCEAICEFPHDVLNGDTRTFNNRFAEHYLRIAFNEWMFHVGLLYRAKNRDFLGNLEDQTTVTFSQAGL
jgi:hypothetical protein